MLPLRSPWLVALVLVTVILAGCAKTGAPGSDAAPSTVSADQLTPAGAKSLLAQAATTMPDVYGMDLVLTSGSSPLLTLHGAFDNASGTAYVELTGNASAIPGMSNGAGASIAPMLKDGATIYVTKQASLYLANGTSFVFPPESEGAAAGLVPAPQNGPLAMFTQPLNGPFKDVLAENNVTVKSVKATTVHGRPAVEMELETTSAGQTVTALVDLYSSPARLAHVESTLPRDPDAPQDPFGGARAVADFAYGSDVTLHPSAAAARSLALAYKSDSEPLSGWKGQATWTFLVSGGVALSEVEAQLKDLSQDSTTAGVGFTNAPTKWSLKLSAGSHAQDGVTIAFDDKDHDEKVSAGDTLTVQTADEHADAPIVVLKDLVTGTYVVPGAGAAALLGVLSLAALVMRRRS